ncbi:MAG TPA: response regulator [Terriglobia bacterium]|nr:response regulator [Terriglobia bacterium]
MGRKVLVIENESSIRNVIYVLLDALRCEGEVAYSGQQALAMIGRENFDAILLDLRTSELPPDQVVSKICEIRPNLVGRILFITGELSDPEIMASIERHCAPYVRRGRLMHDLWDRLHLVFGHTESPSAAR